MAWDALYIGKVIYESCKNVSGLTLNVYPLRIPESVSLTSQPSVVYRIISNSGEDLKDTRSIVDNIRFQVSVWASTYTLSSGIASLIRDSLDGLSGEVAGCSVDYMRFEDESDGYDDEFKLFEHTIDFSARIKNMGSGNINTEPAVALDVTDDYTWSGVIPSGWMVEYLVFEESTGNSGQLSCGTSSGATNVMRSEAITGGGITVISNLTQRISSMSSAITLYINHAGDGDTWNGMNLTVYCVMRKIS